MYAVLVSRHPPEESAASRAEGGAIVGLLRELLRQLHSLTLERVEDEHRVKVTLSMITTQGEWGSNHCGGGVRVHSNDMYYGSLRVMRHRLDITNR